MWTTFGLFFLLALQVNGQSYLDPDSFLAEVTNRVTSLREGVLGQIANGKRSVDSLISAATTQRLSSLTQLNQQLNDKYSALVNRLDVIKSVAGSTNIDVCLADKEATLEDLPTTVKNTLTGCLDPLVQQEETIRTSTQTKINLLINEVNSVDATYSACQRDLLCSAPVVCQVTALQTAIPNQIADFLKKAGEATQIVNVQVQGCTSDAIGNLLKNGAAILDDIDSCVQNVLGDSINV